MKKIFMALVTIFLFLFWQLEAIPPSLGAQLLSSTEGDPEAIIDHKVNVINGDYCEVVTDLVITGPDDLVMQRYFSSCNYVTGEGVGGWRIFPQCWLTVGKDPLNQSFTVSDTEYYWTYAFTGEKSGSIFTYSGWESRTKEGEELRVWAFRDARSLCNTARGEISGRVNPQNGILLYQLETKNYVLTLGDGTKRFFEKVDTLPSLYLGEELNSTLSGKVQQSEQYRLTLEILPSGNRVQYKYDSCGHIARIEMFNASEKKVLSWINFVHQKGTSIVITTSDQRTITYYLTDSLITKVEYSDRENLSYTYNNGKLTQRGKELEIEYDAEGRVYSLKEALSLSDQLLSSKTFFYEDCFTEVQNAMGQKTRYRYSKKEQLEAIEYFDALGVLYRVDRRFWEKKKERCCELVAKTIEDGNGNTICCNRFFYDEYANVIEERLYGNLTGANNSPLTMGTNGCVIAEHDFDCHIKKKQYSKDGFNLITKLGDCKGSETIFTYLPDTNLLVKKIIMDNTQKVKKRFFYSYNDDAVRIQTMEDDGRDNELKKIDNWGVRERHITRIHPKQELPGVGLPLQEIKQVGYKGVPEQVQRMVYTYDSQSRVVKQDLYDAEDVYRYTELWDYDAYGNLIKETDKEGKETLYTYNDLGYCVYQQIPLENITYTFSYDKQGRVIEALETYGKIEQRLTTTYDLLGRKTSSTDRKGNQTDFVYDAKGFLAAVVYPLMKDDQGRISRPTIRYENDLFGNPLRTIDAQGYEMHKQFTLRGTPVSIDYPDGTYELFKYDSEGSLHRHMTRDKIISIFEYDFLGRQVNIERSTAGKNGSGSWIDNVFFKYNTYHLKSVKDKGAFTCYEYDAAGRISKVYCPSKSYEEDDSESRKQEYSYDSLGRLSQKKIYYGTGIDEYYIECQEHDYKDRIIEKRVENSEGITLQASQFIYDSRGLLVEEKKLLKTEFVQYVQTNYNDLGQPIVITDAMGKQTSFLYEDFVDDTGQTVAKKTVIDPSGVSTVIIFDAFDRITSITKFSPDQEIFFKKTIFYDLNGNQTREENLVLSDGRQELRRTAWSFGPMNRLEKMCEAQGTEKERETYYVYGDDGKVSEKFLAGMSSPMTYTYNKQGRLYKIFYREGDENLQISNRYSYDIRGNITSAHSLGGKSIFRNYNVFNEITSETIKDEGSEYSVYYEYDRLGRIIQIRLPDGSKILYYYDALHGKKVSRISSSGKVLYTHEYQEYDDWGRLTKELMPGFLGIRTKEWNLENQQTSSACNDYRENVPQEGYDSSGNLLQLQTTSGDLFYQYNHLCQVVAEQAGVQHTYSYDSIGNRLQKNEEKYTYDPLNQLCTTSQDHYQYDARGSLTQRCREGVNWDFESNILGQLIHIYKNDQTTLRFSYGPFGRRLTKKYFDVSGKYQKKISVSRYLYIGEQEVGIIDQTGEITELSVPGVGRESVLFELQGHIFVPLYDIRGNVVALLDPQWREVVESYRYTCFGEEQIFDPYGYELYKSAVGNPWRYSGKRQDAETGLLFFGFRFYDPVIGRWISPDPALFIDGSNLYAFSQNNPLHYFDHLGFQSENRNSQEFDNYFYGEIETHCFCERHRQCKRGGEIGQMLTYGRDVDYVLFADHFEDSFENKSRLYDLSDEEEFQELSKGMIGFINGIDTPFEDFQSHAKYIGHLAGGYNVHGVYNATHGKSIDACEYALNRLGIATPPVRYLHKKWDAFFAKADPGVPILQICHSQGAILLKNALMSYPVELRKKIIVVAVAPGAYISKRLCKSVRHYVTKWNRDPVPWLDLRGWKKEHYNIISLKPPKDALGFDHGFQSPTYRKVIREEILNYLEKRGA